MSTNIQITLNSGIILTFPLPAGTRCEQITSVKYEFHGPKAHFDKVLYNSQVPKFVMPRFDSPVSASPASASADIFPA